jgi:hypothetical protein
MNSLRHIPAGEILRLSPRHPVTLQDEETDVLDGFFFSSDEDAVTFKAAEREGMWGKIDIPLAIFMRARFREDAPHVDIAGMLERGEYEGIGAAAAGNLNDRFRVVMEDRELAPGHHDGIRAVTPSVLHKGIASLVLDVAEEGDESVFPRDSFWLNVHEPDSPHPINGSLDATLQVFINENSLPAAELLARYTAMRDQAAVILERVVNTPVATG